MTYNVFGGTLNLAPLNSDCGLQKFHFADGNAINWLGCNKLRNDMNYDAAIVDHE